MIRPKGGHHFTILPLQLFNEYSKYQLIYITNLFKLETLLESCAKPCNHLTCFYTGLSFRQFQWDHREAGTENLYFCLRAHSDWNKLTPFSSNFSTMVLSRFCFWWKGLSIFLGGTFATSAFFDKSNALFFQSQV